MQQSRMGVVLCVLLVVNGIHGNEAFDLSTEPPEDAVGVSQQFSDWEKEREVALTDKELSVMNEVSSHVATRAKAKHAALKRTKAEVGMLEKQIEAKGDDVDEKLLDAQNEEAGARRATTQAEKTVVDEKYRSEPLTTDEDDNAKMGERMALAYQESTPRAAHEQAARIAQMEGDVHTRLKEYTDKYALRLAEPFGDRAKHKHRLSKLKDQFSQEFKSEASSQHSALSKLKKELNALKPQLTALQDDEQESRLLRIQYQIVSQKLKQLHMLNKVGGYPTVEHHQAKLTAMGKKAVKAMKNQLDSFTAKLQKTAREEQKAEETISAAAAADNKEALAIVSASTPEELTQELKSQ
jgi:hypothetical protein